MIHFPRDTKGCLAFVQGRKRDYFEPPMPVRVERWRGLGSQQEVEWPEEVITSRMTWYQPQSVHTSREEGVAPGWSTVARQADEVPNPLRELAAALIAAADKADEDGLVPLGINVETRYESMPPDNIALSGDPQIAAVTVSVRGVRQQWIDRVLGEAEQAALEAARD